MEDPVPALRSRPMNARLRTAVTLLATVAMTLALTVGPALATESAPAGGEGGKVPLPETAHDRVGLIILGITALFALAALGNAVKQLKGSRPQADGRIRWR